MVIKFLFCMVILINLKEFFFNNHQTSNSQNNMGLSDNEKRKIQLEKLSCAHSALGRPRVNNSAHAEIIF